MATNATMTTGYGHADYVASLSEFGTPRLLPGSGGWLLERAIPGAPSERDAMGPYPLFACADWTALGDDLEQAGSSLVSVVLVADPFGDHDLDLLSRAFNAGAIPFKQHQIVDLSRPLESSVSSHHRRNVRKALRALEVEAIRDLPGCLDEWLALYENLIRRHDIRGISAFSRRSFALQIATPGLVAYRATLAGETVGIALFYVRGEVAYYHLGAYSDRGYEAGAAFAVFWTALSDLASHVRLVSLGGDAGLGGEDGGLARFKRGWATDSRTAYLCRHVGDRARYEALSTHGSTAYFPAYRAADVGVATAPTEVRPDV